jgi:nucleotide-binding universal stress UspA family protein
MYTKILVPLDGSELAECVFPYVKWFTEVSDINEIIFLRIVEPLHMTGDLEGNVPPEQKEQLDKEAAQVAREYLEKISEQYKDGKRKISLVVLTGKPAQTIAEYVAKSDVDLIIMATHGYSGFHRWVSGSVADEVLHAALVPIFLVRPEDRPPDK